MAQKVIIQLVDDLDGSQLGQGEGETVQFALEGKQYEIDLSNENVQRLRDALKEFIDAARTPSRNQGSGRRSASSSRTSQRRDDLAEVREWARRNGHQVSDRGRVAQPILDAYDAAQGA